MSDELRNFLIDLATFLRGHGYEQASLDLLEAINQEVNT